MTSSFSLLSAILFATLAAIATCAPAIFIASPTNNTFTTFQCTDSQKWAAPGFHPKDCYKAVASGAFVDELTDFGADEVEFYTFDGGPEPLPVGNSLQEVPRKYTFGKSKSTKHLTPSASPFGMLNSFFECIRQLHHDYCNDA